MGTKIQRGAVRRKIGSAVAGIFFGIGSSTAGAADPVFASPLPPGPGQVPVVSGSLVAPILMPLSAPTAAPVGVYLYGAPVDPATGSGTGSSFQAASCDAPVVPRGHRVWVAADYFYGAGQGSGVPPLATTSPAGTPAQQAGALGIPTTTTAFGGRRENNEFRPGFRLEMGVWCDDGRTQGFDASYFFLGRRGDGYAATQPDPAGPQLFQPVTVGTTNVGIPLGTTPAGISAHASTDIAGADLNYRRNWIDECGTRIDLLAGYRFLSLGDEVEVATYRLSQGTAAPINSASDSSFRTRNEFHGGQIGVSACHGFASGLTVELQAKCALGVTLARADLAGSTTALGATVPTSLLVGPTNAGRFTDRYFAVVPEADVRVGYGLTDRVRINAGYSFLYWSKVQRAADQIDLTTGTNRPAYPAQTTDYWVQGWTLGLEVRY